jgi:hypothetical protein
MNSVNPLLIQSPLGIWIMSESRYSKYRALSLNTWRWHAPVHGAVSRVFHQRFKRANEHKSVPTGFVFLRLFVFIATQAVEQSLIRSEQII